MSALRLSHAAQACVEETGIDPQDDVAALISGRHSATSLLDYCLDGADSDREPGWREYVDAVVAQAESTLMTHAQVNAWLDCRGIPVTAFWQEAAGGDVGWGAVVPMTLAQVERVAAIVAAVQ